MIHRQLFLPIYTFEKTSFAEKATKNRLRRDLMFRPPSSVNEIPETPRLLFCGEELHTAPGAALTWRLGLGAGVQVRLTHPQWLL